MTVSELVQDRAERDGKTWAAQFRVAGDDSTQEKMRGMIASAFAAGWMMGYVEGVTDVSKIVEDAVA